jgi:hypothetical protein
VKVIDAATLKGDGRANQDRYLVENYYAAVFDGASAFWPPRSADRDGGWYAEELASAVNGQMDRSSDLQQILRDALERLKRDHALLPGSPSSTVAIVRWDHSNLDCLVLGDSPIAVMFANGDVEVVADRRLSTIGTEQRTAYRNRLKAGEGFGSTHRELLRSLQIEQANLRNRSRGYWIAADDPSAASQSLTVRYPRMAIDAVLLMTDGASAIVDCFGLATWASLPNRVKRDGCAKLLSQVSHAESADPDARHWPRSKKHDDKTILLVAEV